ncbi:MAG: ISL3 family transposase [Candidatus Brocadiales bacterium]|nr:ISL3 family transposase [Candidatus Brocadiales bacterium]
MSITKFIERLLKIKAFSVKSFKFEDRYRKIRLEIKPYKNGALCPYCHKRGKIIYTLEHPRIWRDVPVCGNEVFLEYCPREIYCKVHGRVQEEIPWAASNARVTYRFEYMLLIYCTLMTQKAAAHLLKMAVSTLSDLLHRIITRVRTGHKIRKLKTIGIDEISYCKGRKYATIVYDLERSCVVWIGQGKARDTIDRFFKEQLSQYQRNRIVLGCCDMSETFIGAIEKWCPNATLILDRFHIAKALNDAVDEIRKQEWREADTINRKALKGLRWLLYKHSSNRSDEDTQTLKSLYRGNRRIYRSWVLKDEFEQFWDFKDRKTAETFLDAWCKTAAKSRLDSIKTFVKTIRKHKHRLVPFVEHRLTNAVAEGINRIIKIVKNRASGFRTLSAFSDLIYLTVGDLNIPDQIAPKFRTV